MVYSPQIYENYSLQSGEGLSVLFVVVWLLGDLCNFFGAALAGLLPTVIILAIYVRNPSILSMKSYIKKIQVFPMRYHSFGPGLLLPFQETTNPAS